MSKPTFIIIPGAWYSPDSFEPTTKILQSQGYKVRGVTLACWGAEPPIQDTKPDAEVIHREVQAELDAGNDVIVVMHSYGGTAGGEGLAKIDPKRVRQLFYVSAFLFPEGVSCMDALGGQDAPWFVVNGDYVRSSNEHDIFYNDLSAEEAQKQIAKLKHHSYRCFYSKQTHAPWRNIPSTYVFCTDDHALPIDAQKGMVEGARELEPAAFPNNETMDTSHSPFLSKPEELAQILIKGANA